MMKRSAIALLFALAACGGSGGGGTGPDPRDAVIGIWTMTSVNGRPLPYDEASATGAVIRGGAIRFARVAGGNVFEFCRATPSPGNPPFVFLNREDFVFEVDGQRVLATYLQGARASLPPDTATVLGSTLTLRRTFEPDRRVYTFTKTSATPGDMPASC